MRSSLRILPILVIGVSSLFGADIRTAEPANLTVHEWGTFTSIAGEDGMAIKWQPLDGPTDLPCFVYRFEHGAKADLSGTVRMETPVIYFYSPGATTANVGVTFPDGFITEWYPKANRVTRYLGSGIPPRGPDVRQPGANESDSIEWPQIKLAPSLGSAAFPFEFLSSHYYAARSTDAVPLLAGREKEKFLFYRGVGRFQPPIAVSAMGADQVVVKNLGRDEIPSAIFFENRDGRISYRAQGPIRIQATFQETQPAADLAALKNEMEQTLVSQGLYPKEAKAMVATWSDSWFEEGTRVFYFLPPSAVDRLLPLEIQPAPAHITRVFVGRVEVFTPATKKAITEALSRGDWRPFAKYGRFLGPIASGMGDGPWITQLYSRQAEYRKRETACGTGGW